MLCKYVYIVTNCIVIIQTRHVYGILTEYICFTRINLILFSDYNLKELSKVKYNYLILIINILGGIYAKALPSSRYSVIVRKKNSQYIN